MALRKPLVMVTGQIQQLQSGDVLDVDVVGEVDVISMINDTGAAALVIGAPVYCKSAGKVDNAKADAVATVEVIGLAQAGIVYEASGNIQTDGVLTLTTAQWDAITGDTGGLTFNDVYYLDASTAGMLTTTAPTTTGQFVVKIGKAVSTTDMEISILNAVKL